MQAAKRNIKSGKEYDRFFGKSLGTYDILKSDADVFDSVSLIKKKVKNHARECEQIANHLKGKNIRDTCHKIWDFVYSHIQYKLDEVGEEIRTPNRIWADRRTGVDCDDYTVFLSSCLNCLGIKHIARMTKFKGDWQHIYIVAYDEQGKEIIMDCVTDTYNYEVPFTNKKDYDMFQLASLGRIEIDSQAMQYLQALSENYEGLARGLAMAKTTSQGRIEYEKIFENAQNQFGINRGEFEAAINEGKGKKIKPLAGLGLDPIVGGAIIGGVTNLLSTGLSFIPNQNIQNQKEISENNALVAQEQTFQTQLAVQSQLEQKKIDAQQAEKDREFQKQMLIYGGAALFGIGLIYIIATSSSGKKSKKGGLKGLPKGKRKPKASSKKNYRGKKRKASKSKKGIVTRKLFQ